MLHLDFDQYPKNGVDEENLRSEWDAFLDRRPAPLAHAVLARAAAESAEGAVITCPSGVVLSGSEILAAESYGFRVAILFGPRAVCREAFLNGPHGQLGAKHWDLNNARYAELSSAELETYRIPAFRDGGRRSVSEIVTEARARAAR